MPTTVIDAEPAPIAIDRERVALLIIDMQRDFLEPGGFGESLGNDVALLSAAIGPCRALLDGARKAGLLVIHTREGHRPDLADAPSAKIERGAPRQRIGDKGPMGRILVRGEPGHDIVPARGGEVETLEGDWTPARLVLLEFPSVERARAWWSAPEAATVKALRQQSARTRMIIVAGA